MKTDKNSSTPKNGKSNVTHLSAMVDNPSKDLSLRKNIPLRSGTSPAPILKGIPALLRERFYYNSKTGAFVSRPRPRRDFSSDLEFKRWNDIYASQSVHLDGLLPEGSLLNFIFPHSANSLLNLVYAYVFGVWPTMQLYPINQKPTDTRFSNITDSPVYQNFKESAVVSRAPGGDSWCVAIPTSIDEEALATFDTEAEALAARKSALRAIRKTAPKLTTPDGCQIYIAPEELEKPLKKKRRVMR